MTEAGAVRRGAAARLGIVVLNLILPGLGLARLGAWRAAGLFLALPFLFFALLTAGVGLWPITGHAHALIALAMIVASFLAFYAAAFVLSWRWSRWRRPPAGWSRGWRLAAFALMMLVLLSFVAPTMHRFYKPFYVPSTSMTPTLVAGDKLVADMRWRDPLRPGQVILFDGPEAVRIGRVVALGGARVAMRGGVPVVNGRPAAQQRTGAPPAALFDGRPGAVLNEQLPGERSTHRVIDAGPSPLDDTPERVVPPGHVFVLGDNRDDAADSRVPPDMGGTGPVPVAAIIGRPLYIHWSADRMRIGTRFDD